MSLKSKNTGEDILGIAVTVQGIWKVARIFTDHTPVLGNIIITDDDGQRHEIAVDGDNVDAVIAQGSRVWVGAGGETFTDREVVAPDPADPSKMVDVRSLEDDGLIELPLTKHIDFLWRTEVANLRTNYGLREWVDALSPFEYLEKHGFEIEEANDSIRINRAEMSTGWFAYGQNGLHGPLRAAIDHVRRVFELIA